MYHYWKDDNTYYETILATKKVVIELDVYNFLYNLNIHKTTERIWKDSTYITVELWNNIKNVITVNIN